MSVKSIPAARRQYIREYMWANGKKIYRRNCERLHQLLGNKCAVCGETEKLTVNNKDLAVSKDELVDLSHLWSLSIEKLAAYLPKIHLLCPQHRQDARRKIRPFTHGLWWAAYKKKCQCEECEEFRANYALERRENRRYKKLGLKPKTGLPIN